MQALQQGDELAATMFRLDIGDDFAAVQVQRGENRQRAVAHVFVVARHRRLLPRYRRQIRGGGADGLYARLLVHGYRVGGGRSGVARRRRQEHLAIDHQDFPHLAVELRVATFQIVSDPMRLQIVLLQDAPDAALADARQARKPDRLGFALQVGGQCRQRPQLRRQAQRLGLLACHADHPGFCVRQNLGLPRAVVTISQARAHARRQRLVDAFVDGWARYADFPLYLRDRQPRRVLQQHRRPRHLARRRRRRAAQRRQHLAIRFRQLQRRALCSSGHVPVPDWIGSASCIGIAIS